MEIINKLLKRNPTFNLKEMYIKKMAILTFSCPTGMYKLL
jgi:hypothetical protein